MVRSLDSHVVIKYSGHVIVTLLNVSVKLYSRYLMLWLRVSHIIKCLDHVIVTLLNVQVA